jgi:2-phosphosulfolactate phosphatase
MKIEILEFISGAEKATGVTVIIDVFRAFSTACYASDAGAVRIIATSEVQKAFELRNSYKNCVLSGESDEKNIEGFDFGNSPTEIIKADLSGKTVIQTTTAGTRGLINAVNADVLLTGSFVNADAVTSYIKALNPANVSLVAMGYRGTISSEEDFICAEMIKSGLEGKGTDFNKRISDLRYGAGKRFFNPENLYFSPPTDFFLCTMKNRFSFILKGEKRHDGNVDLMRINL